MKYLLIFTLFIALASCQKIDLSTKKIKMLTSPVESNTSLPFLKVGEDQQLYLSWVVENKEQAQLKYALMKEEGIWSASAIASGEDWFVNWADYPSINIDQKGNKLSHYLAKSTSGTYSYDINLTLSRAIDNWSESFIPHQDKTPTEHGFVSVIPSVNSFIVAWLDGRNTGGESHESHGHQGTMTLRTATIDLNGHLSDEVELDNRVCDCCQTSGAITSNGPIFVYRDRSEDEIRDIAIVRRINGAWTIPKSIYHDQWKIAGCPVNGPRIAAQGSQVVVAWFSAPESKPQVKLIFSNDAGATFGKPLLIDGEHSLGRVDVAIDEEGIAYVSWLSSIENKSEIKAIAANSDGIIGQSIIIAETSPSRSSGFPQMELFKNELYFAWTTTAEDASHIQMAKITL
jgi:hypothetical protein